MIGEFYGLSQSVIEFVNWTQIINNNWNTSRVYSRGKTLRIGKLCAPVWDIIKSYKKGNLSLAQQFIYRI